MKMQALKGVVVAAFLVLLGVCSAHASLRLRADIPFQFTVGSTTLPAGSYAVTEVATGVLVIRNEKLGQNAALVSGSVVGAPQEGTDLIFVRTGNNYSLTQVQSYGAREELRAANGSGAQPVVVAVALR